MTVFLLASAALIVIGLSFAVHNRRRRRARPSIYHIAMAEHLWQPSSGYKSFSD